MKLRLLDDSIRLRLSRSDVAAAANDGRVQAQTHFPGGRTFTYVLETSPNGSAVEAAYTGNCMVLRIPRADVAAWADDDTAVSLRRHVDLADGELLKVLIEKDFQCLSHRHDEDQSDLYPNPETSPC